MVVIRGFVSVVLGSTGVGDSCAGTAGYWVLTGEWEVFTIPQQWPPTPKKPTLSAM